MPKRKLFFYDENANDIPEEDEEDFPQEDTSTSATYNDVDVTSTPSLHLEVNNSSSTIINDDSGCFLSDTSLKFPEKAEIAAAIDSERTRRLSAREDDEGVGGGKPGGRCGGITHRTGIDGSFWDLNDGSNQKAFIAIFVKKSLELDVVPSKEPPSSRHCIRIENYEELPQESSTVSVQLGEHFCLRTSDNNNNKKKSKRPAVHQRKNEWRKNIKLRQ